MCVICGRRVIVAVSGVVSQEALLFNATVAENIAYGRPMDHARVVRAASIAHADEFVQSLPRRYETVMGDRGIRLSGDSGSGSPSRGLYGAPDVLVLDEATSALDSESEAYVQAAIDEVIKDITAVVIAHRLSTVMRADRIVLVNEGRVEAVGTPRGTSRAGAAVSPALRGTVGRTEDRSTYLTAARRL
jgi:ABC-type multidrug transport system fused ATPase/permease subunit